jgi:hypothetical protein
MNVPNPAADLTRALERLQPVFLSERPPTPEDAMELLVPLGALLMEGDFTSAAPTMDYLGQALEGQSRSWRVVIEGAVADVTDSYCARVEPLDALKGKSKIAALAELNELRERLEALRQAALGLNLPPSEAQEGRIQSADTEFERHLDGA